MAAEAAPPAPFSAQPLAASAQRNPSPTPVVQTEVERSHLPEPDLVSPAGSMDPVLGSPLPGLQTPHVGGSDSEDPEEKNEPSRKLSASEKHCISEEFQDWIQSNHTIRLEDVRFQLRNQCSVALKKLLLVNNMDVNIANRIRHCQSTVPPSLGQEESHPSDLVKDWQDAQSVASKDAERSSRWEWSDKDAEFLLTLFGDRGVCPSRRALADQQQSSEQLQELIQRNSLECT